MLDDEIWRVEGASGSTASEWTIEPQDGAGASDWGAEADRIHARGDGTARFSAHGGGPIFDQYGDGYPPAVRERLTHPRQSGRNPVGDLRLVLRVRALAGCTSLAFSIEEGGLLHRFTLPGPAAGVEATPRLESVPRPGRREGPPPRSASAAAPWRLPEGQAVEIELENLDDRLALRIDGRELVALEVESVLVQSDSAVRLEQRGAGADLSGLRLWRDVYYEPGRFGGPWSIPAGSYFMLGDNTQDSSDSRDWMLATLGWGAPGSQGESATGNWRPQGAFAPAAADDNPITGRGPEPLTAFRDVWGERHLFASSLVRGAPATSAAPFVPRELITGRAVASLWPIAPRLGVWRPKWIR